MPDVKPKSDLRHDGRRPDELRPITIQRGFVTSADADHTWTLRRMA